jgi:hypothetical protein
LKNDKKSTTIDEEIRFQFKNVTQMRLIDSNKYSQIVCEICLRSLNLAYAVKEEFCENQKKLQEEIYQEAPKLKIVEYHTEPTRKKRTYESNGPNELNTIIKIENDKVIEVIDEKGEEQYEEYSEYDDSFAQKPTNSVSWNFTNKKIMQLNREEKVSAIRACDFQ